MHKILIPCALEALRAAFDQAAAAKAALDRIAALGTLIASRRAAAVARLSAAEQASAAAATDELLELAARDIDRLLAAGDASEALPATPGKPRLARVTEADQIAAEIRHHDAIAAALPARIRTQTDLLRPPAKILCDTLNEFGASVRAAWNEAVSALIDGGCGLARLVRMAHAIDEAFGGSRYRGTLSETFIRTIEGGYLFRASTAFDHSTMPPRASDLGANWRDDEDLASLVSATAPVRSLLKAIEAEIAVLDRRLEAERAAEEAKRRREKFETEARRPESFTIRRGAAA